MTSITVSGKMDYKTEKAHSSKLREPCTRVNGLKVKDMDRVSRPLNTIKSSMMVNLIRMTRLAMVVLFTRMVTTLETLLEENSKERANIPSKTPTESITRNIRETSRKTRSLATER